MTYDRIFRKFQEKLLHEYGAMRGGYMTEYQANFEQNSSRRDNKLSEMNMAIEGQSEYGRDLEKTIEQQDSCLHKFFVMKSNLFTLRTIMKKWKAYIAVYKQKARVAAYRRNTLYRKKLKLLFTTWRSQAHEWFKERIERERALFREELESRILI